jgi:hypothetical protein
MLQIPRHRTANEPAESTNEPAISTIEPTETTIEPEPEPTNPAPLNPLKKHASRRSGTHPAGDSEPTNRKMPIEPESHRLQACAWTQNRLFFLHQ